LAFAEPEVAFRGALLLLMVFIGVIGIALVGSRPPEPPPCSTWALPRSPMM
jgi:hypothetical protein